MSTRRLSLAAFRDAVASLGLPASDDEVETLYHMVMDLHALADELHQFLTDSAGPNPLTASDRRAR
jgi:hypothetical protein